MIENSYYHQVLSFANQNPACHLATTEGNRPHVRGMLMWYADETGFYFHTASTKNLAKQIIENPNVEVAFYKYTENPSETSALRVSGKVEIIEDSELEQRLLIERPWLNEFKNISNEIKTVIFRVKNGEAYLWDLTKNIQEDSIERVAI